jgi:hypothetical protein
MLEVQYRPAWRRNDPVIERDAEIFWRREHALSPPGVSKRLPNLCAVAYQDNEVVASAIAQVRLVDFLHCKLAMYQCYVAKHARRRHIATQLTVFSRKLLESWAREHPEEGVLGYGAIIRSRLLVQNRTEAIYPSSNLALAGYTSAGYQIRISWFAHAQISRYWPGRAGDPDVGEDADDQEQLFEGGE